MHSVSMTTWGWVPRSSKVEMIICAQSLFKGRFDRLSAHDQSQDEICALSLWKRRFDRLSAHDRLRR
jgi:hypothetical protein